MAKQIKSLNDLAKVYKNKVLTSINPGVPYKSYKTGSSKAYKTGKLFSSVASSNRIDRMFTIDKKTQSFVFNFDIAPQGAPYGKYVHNGTSKMGPRPYAEIAAESPEFKKALDEYINENVVKGKLDSFFEGLNEQFKDGGFKVS